MRGIVWTRVYAAWLGVVVAQVTRRRFHLHASNLVSRMIRIIQLRWKWMQIDISVWAIGGAEAAADTPVFNDHLKSIAATDGADGASHHAERIATLAT